MEQLKKDASYNKNILVLAIISLVFSFGGIVSIIVYASQVGSGSVATSGFIASSIVSLLMFIISAICNLIGSIMILAGNWSDRQTDNSWLLWGLLALLLLGWIALLIFYVTTKNKIERAMSEFNKLQDLEK